MAAIALRTKIDEDDHAAWNELILAYNEGQQKDPPLPQGAGHVFETLTGLATKLGYTVTFDDDEVDARNMNVPAAFRHLVWGTTNIEDQTIVLRPRAMGLQTAMTFAHEIGHALLHVILNYRGDSFLRLMYDGIEPIAEMVAEAVGYQLITDLGVPVPMEGAAVYIALHAPAPNLAARAFRMSEDLYKKTQELMAS